MCITHHTSDLASPILEMIFSKSSENFKKMLEQRIHHILDRDRKKSGTTQVSTGQPIQMLKMIEFTS